jgi:hypothetical protein
MKPLRPKWPLKATLQVMCWVRRCGNSPAYQLPTRHPLRKELDRFRMSKSRKKDGVAGYLRPCTLAPQHYALLFTVPQPLSCTNTCSNTSGHPGVDGGKDRCGLVRVTSSKATLFVAIAWSCASGPDASSTVGAPLPLPAVSIRTRFALWWWIMVLPDRRPAWVRAASATASFEETDSGKTQVSAVSMQIDQRPPSAAQSAVGFLRVSKSSWRIAQTKVRVAPLPYRCDLLSFCCAWYHHKVGGSRNHEGVEACRLTSLAQMELLHTYPWCAGTALLSLDHYRTRAYQLYAWMVVSYPQGTYACDFCNNCYGFRGQSYGIFCLQWVLI